MYVCSLASGQGFDESRLLVYDFIYCLFVCTFSSLFQANVKVFEHSLQTVNVASRK